jgi:CrcB protein
MVRILFLVGAGGFLGSILRFIAQAGVEKYTHLSFQWGTMFVNVSGSLILGILYALSEKQNILSTDWRLFLAVGFCGGFTTFSAFSLDSFRLLKASAMPELLVYSLGSIFAGIVSLYAGIIVARQLI